MNRRPGYSPEVRERAVRLVLTTEHAQQLATEWLWIYNNERPHTAINGVSPRQMLKAA